MRVKRKYIIVRFLHDTQSDMIHLKVNCDKLKIIITYLTVTSKTQNQKNPTNLLIITRLTKEIQRNILKFTLKE